MDEAVNIYHIFCFFEGYAEVVPFVFAEGEADVVIGCAQYQAFGAIGEREQVFVLVEFGGKILEEPELLGREIEQQVVVPDGDQFAIHTLADDRRSPMT